jgi:DNA-binding MarR family transcriptional regulator
VIYIAFVAMGIAASPAARAGSSAVRELAQFRYRLRRFLRFSEQAARAAGVTPQQHQLMLGVAGFTGRGWATISELAECLQERHNAVVTLVNRAVEAGLVRKRKHDADRRVVRVELTARGQHVLGGLTRLHRREIARFRREQPILP